MHPSPSTLTRSLSKNTFNSCYKVHHCLYNTHQQHGLFVLQQDCFHIKIYKKEITSTHSFIRAGLLVDFPVIHFFFLNNLTKTMSTHIFALKCKQSFITPILRKQPRELVFFVASTVQVLNPSVNEIVLKY